MYLVSFLAIIIGILLGLLGGGGSILTVPVLVYLADLPAKSAIVTSLIVVGSTSIIATLSHARKKHVCWKTGAIFGSAGMFGAFIGGRLTTYVPDALLLVLLGCVMLLASLSMVFRKNAPAKNMDTKECLENTSFCPMELPIVAILLDGFFLGIITGLVGVGGGFLLVPALTHLASLPVHAAIGTSLFIISLQSAAALLGHANHLTIDIELTAIVTCLAIAGSFIGAKLAHYLPAKILKRGFGFFVLFLGSGLLYKEINRTVIAQIETLIGDYQQFILGVTAVIMSTFLYRLWLWLHTKKSKI
ncbi:MAG: TSUP family transporter [Methyloprofundus sp.]|nr:TSUP family transporter [Methyloprofundus sp.]